MPSGFFETPTKNVIASFFESKGLTVMSRLNVIFREPQEESTFLLLSSYGLED